MSTLETIEDRIIVIGSGLAGLVTALSLAPHPVTIVTRAALGAETSSAWAQGGIAASMGTDDSEALHTADTLAAGDGLCDPDIVEMITSAAPAAIAMLERFGVRFDRNAEGELALGLEAAHGRRRIVHAGGDGSGAEIMRSLTAAVLAAPSISVMSGLQVRRLLVNDDRITGLLCASASGPVQIAASRVVLATGGLGGLYDGTTNPSGNYGQGIMLAARAGAVLSDMEFVQFHPTALDVPLYPQPLVSEAVRGEGAVLINERGERFMASTPEPNLRRVTWWRGRSARNGPGEARLPLMPERHLVAIFPAGFRSSMRSAGRLESIHQRSRSRCAPPRITTWAVWRPIVSAEPRLPVSGRQARWPAPVCMVPTVWPATRCWKRQ